MILVDSNIWSRHFRHRDAGLEVLLDEALVVTHHWIVGELALGPGASALVLENLIELPALPTLDDHDLLEFVQLHRLRGIGWVDAQLLASALTAGVDLLTADRALAALAERFGIAASLD